MAYTPINWATGDTITAEKLNKMDNGWGYESTQLFSETVTTAVDPDHDYAVAQLVYSQLIDADTITVTYDGTEYVCSRVAYPDGNAYGAPWSDKLNAYDFSVCPFSLYAESGYAALATQTASTHTISVAEPTLQTSADFEAAVNACNTPTTPMRCVSGMTYRLQIEDAIAAGKLVYFWTSNHGCFFITKAGRPFTIFPESSEVTATHNSTGLLIITES